VLSLSTGAFILASCGFLKNRRVAVFPPFASDLKQIEPTARIVCHERVALDEAKWLSTSGMSCSVDAAAALVAKLEGSLAADLALRRISWPIPINDIISLYSS
jgi:transcriptional regulator GlxA family with amidase domain